MMVESQIPGLIGPESSPGFLPSAKLTPVTRLPLSIPDMYLDRKTGRCSPRMITIPPRADPYVDIVSRAWKANPTLGPPVFQDVVPVGASAAACQLPAFAHEGHPFQGLCSMAALSTRAVETCARALAPATQPLGFFLFLGHACSLPLAGRGRMRRAQASRRSTTWSVPCGPESGQCTGGGHSNKQAFVGTPDVLGQVISGDIGAAAPPDGTCAPRRA